jgi:hypothetical protein
VSGREFETACLLARAAAVELDQASAWRAYDPERYARAKARATIEFDALVAAFKREVGHA